MIYENDKFVISERVLKMGKKELQRRQKAELKKIRSKMRKPGGIKSNLANCPVLLAFEICLIF